MKTSLLLVMAVVACATASFSCKKDGAPTTANASPRAAGVEPIVIGVSLGLSGELSARSVALQNATRVAERYINSAGGILDRPVKFEIVDDASQGQEARSVAGDFIAQGVAGMLGPVESGQAREVSPLFASAQILELSATASSSLLTAMHPAKDRWFFRTAPSDELEAKVFASFVRRGPTAFAPAGSGDAGALVIPGCRTMAMVYVDEPEAAALGAAIKAELTKLGGALVVEEKLPYEGQRSYAAVAERIVAAHPECQALLVSPSVGGTFMTDLRRAIVADATHDWSRFFAVATDKAHDDDLIKRSQTDPANPRSPASTEGIYGTAADTAPETADYHAFVKLYTASYPLPEGETDPPPFTANQFDAAILLALAIQHAGTSDGTTLIRDSLNAVSKGGKAFGPANLVGALAALRKGVDIDYAGASGEVDFDDYGNVVAGIIIWQNQKRADGSFKLQTLAHVDEGAYR